MYELCVQWQVSGDCVTKVTQLHSSFPINPLAVKHVQLVRSFDIGKLYSICLLEHNVLMISLNGLGLYCQNFPTCCLCVTVTPTTRPRHSNHKMTSPIIFPIIFDFRWEPAGSMKLQNSGDCTDCEDCQDRNKEVRSSIACLLWKVCQFVWLTCQSIEQVELCGIVKDETINQSINQSINRSINQSNDDKDWLIDQSFNWTID